MAFLVVVKRDEPDLFEYLRAHFQEADVTVLLDRRCEERRVGGSPVPEDRRGRDRRTIAAADDPLWRYGFRVAIAQPAWRSRPRAGPSRAVATARAGPIARPAGGGRAARPAAPR